MNLKIISAGAGSGKTFRLTEEMTKLLKEDVRANGIIATTFTKKAAAELQERVRVKLLEAGMTEEANELTNALIGTVHGLGVKLLKRFAYEAGVSPEVAIMAEEDQQVLFNNSLATVLTRERIHKMEALGDRLGLNKKERYDWRKVVKDLTDVARANDFDEAALEKSKTLSIQSFQQFLGKKIDQPNSYFNERLLQLLEESIQGVDQEVDSTKTTQTALNTFRGFATRLRLKGELNWHEWVKIAKIKIGAKSRDAIAELVEFAKTHDGIPAFHEDIDAFISGVFELAIAALEEYDLYKKQRGLIDYTDMEIQVKRLLDHPRVQKVLEEELDLLMVDEFQDTSPIQLEIFLKLSRIAKNSVWVGDPKQSIYGFRGADPKLMLAIIEKNGGVKAEDIQEFSWRSREDIVYLTNALFVKAFQTLPSEQVALKAKRTKMATPESANEINEPMEMGDALMHWHFEYDGEGKRLPGKPWMENCIASEVVKMLERGALVFPKGGSEFRAVRPGDIAVLCRSNFECDEMATALHKAGVKAAIARNGLLRTAESKLILACLKYILHATDSLSVAEILLLAERMKIEDIIEDRLRFLEEVGEDFYHSKWGAKQAVIQKLDRLRAAMLELSGAEILNLLLEELDLRRIIASWGGQEQRMANIDRLRSMALQYEDACNRLHSAASLGGFLLWLNEMEHKGLDKQGAGDGPDAVNVLTYHKSKGLEWPVVICHSLESKLRDKLWGLEIIPETEEVDLNNILGNRWLRYWINPYSDQIHNTALEERLHASEAKKAAYNNALAEDARLLYVGITRARDYLVFPSRAYAPKWLNRSWHEGKEEFPVLDAASNETPWEWNGQPLFMDTEVIPYPRDFTVAPPPEEQIYFQESRPGQQELTPLEIDLNTEKVQEAIKGKAKSAQSYAAAFKVPEEMSPAHFAKAIKALINADHTDYDHSLRLSMTEGILERFEVPDELSAVAFLAHSNAYHQWLESHFRPNKTHRKYPIQLHRDQRIFNTVIDLILETNEGIILIQNSGFSGAQKQWKAKAMELRDWMYLSKQALAALYQHQQIRTFVHLPIGGALVELEIDRKKGKANPEAEVDQLKLF